MGDSKMAWAKTLVKCMSYLSLVKKFPDERTSEEWFKDIRWGDTGIYCSNCGSMDMIFKRESRHAYYCGDCEKYFSVRTRSVLECSNIPLQKWAIAIYLHLTSLKGVSSMELHRDLGITTSTAATRSTSRRARRSRQPRSCLSPC